MPDEKLGITITPDTSEMRRALESMRRESQAVAGRTGTFGSAVQQAGGLPVESPFRKMEDLLKEIRDTIKSGHAEGQKQASDWKRLGMPGGVGGGLSGLLGPLALGGAGLMAYNALSGGNLPGGTMFRTLAGAGIGASFGGIPGAVVGGAFGAAGTEGLKWAGTGAVTGAGIGALIAGPAGILPGAMWGGIAGTGAAMATGEEQGRKGLFGGYGGTALGAYMGFQQAGLAGGFLGAFGGRAGEKLGRNDLERALLAGGGGALMGWVGQEAQQRLQEGLQFRFATAQARLLGGGGLLDLPGLTGLGISRQEMAGRVPGLYQAGLGAMLGRGLTRMLLEAERTRGAPAEALLGAMGGTFRMMGMEPGVFPWQREQAQQGRQASTAKTIIAEGVSAGFERQLPRFAGAVSAGVARALQGQMVRPDEAARASASWARAVGGLTRQGYTPEAAVSYVGAIQGGFRGAAQELLPQVGGGLLAPLMLARMGGLGVEPGMAPYLGAAALQRLAREPGSAEAYRLTRPLHGQLMGPGGFLTGQMLFPQLAQQDPNAFVGMMGRLREAGRTGEAGITQAEWTKAVFGIEDATKSETEVLKDFRDRMREDLGEVGAGLEGLASLQNRQLAVSLQMLPLGQQLVGIQLLALSSLARMAGEPMKEATGAIQRLSGLLGRAGGVRNEEQAGRLMQDFLNEIRTSFLYGGVSPITRSSSLRAGAAQDRFQALGAGVSLGVGPASIVYKGR